MKYIAFVITSLISLNSLAINPDRNYEWTPETFGLTYQEYQLVTPDGFSINVWEYTVPDSVNKKEEVIIAVGPDAGNMSYSVYQLKALVERGYKVISFDYRGFGHSNDFEINKDFLYYNEFAIDLDTVIKATKAKFPESKLGLYGMSMGTYISLLSRENVDFCIAEAFFNDPHKVVNNLKINKSKEVLLPAQVEIVEASSIPTLIFCGTKDLVTSCDIADQFEENSKRVQSIKFEGDHMAGRITMPEGDYYNSIFEFLERL
ncbi:alpha/beta fold hydrolase [Fulvivirga sp. RKSG066]|uniref:alpha/beta hydrolase n=1 Tax=Fulvivirga aurantia TaxID=2529383 RepID=UPI0012BD7D51|nr:alpha/beta fold hydrolase [Fulvivirga aurantia]MTI21005.1 alpha/beta fold hydrolase [Fulvivirga aurantia]